MQNFTINNIIQAIPLEVIYLGKEAFQSWALKKSTYCLRLGKNSILFVVLHSNLLHFTLFLSDDGPSGNLLQIVKGGSINEGKAMEKNELRRSL